MYYCGQLIYTIPEYIYRKVKASANIYIIEYAEAFIFSDTSACLLFTISICCQYMYANFASDVGGALRIIMASYTRVHIQKDGAFFQFLYNRLRRRLHFFRYIYTTYAQIHTIEMQPLCHTRIHTSGRVGKCQYLYNRLCTYLPWMTYPNTYQ